MQGGGGGRLETNSRDVNKVSGRKLHEFEIICQTRGACSHSLPPLHTGLQRHSVELE